MTDRRTFLGKLAKGAVYAAPVIYTLATPRGLMAVYTSGMWGTRDQSNDGIQLEGQGTKAPWEASPGPAAPWSEPAPWDASKRPSSPPGGGDSE